MRYPSIEYPILTPRLFLRPFELTDFHDVHEIHRRDDVVRYLYWEPKSEDQTRQTLEERVSKPGDLGEGDGLVLAVVLRERPKLIGEMSLMKRSAEHRQAELGYVFNPEFQGRGYATEASDALLRIAFETFGFHRVFARCDERNAASYALMERLGMRREGLLVHNEIFKGEWSSEYYYAILANEWRVAHELPPRPEEPV